MIRTKLKEVSQNRWIKVLILFFTFQFSLCTSPVIAQVVDNADIVDDEETDDEDDIIDVRAEDEISVTDQDGNEAVI
jgi:hypothetical protein